MKKQWTMKEVMSRKLVTIGLDQPLMKAYELMSDKGIRHLPVMKGNHLAGIISDRDVRFAISFYEKLDRPTSTLKVEDAFVDDPYTVSVTDSLHKVALEMAERRIGSALVVEKEKPVGVFTTTDACRTLAEILGTH